MIRLIKIYCAVAALFLLACAGEQRVVDLDGFSLESYTPKYATGFSVRMLPDSTASLVTITKPWQGARNNDQHLLLLGEDMTPPEGFAGAVLHTSAKRVITLSSSNIAMLEAVGVSDRVVGVSGIDYITNPAVIDSYNSGRTLDIGYGSALNFEAIVALRPDIVLLYGVSGEDVAVTQKLKELGIQYLYIGDYAEQSPLGKAEWMVAIAEICGVGEVAVERFNEVAARYTHLRDSVASQYIAYRPLVMLNTPYREVWYMPSSTSYMAQLIADAGGEYIYAQNSGDTTRPISLEQAYELVSQADVWLNMGATIRSVEALKLQNPLFADVTVVGRGELYNTTARTTAMGGSDFWESGVVNPDVVLRDLIHIFHPTEGGEQSLYYYEKLK